MCFLLSGCALQDWVADLQNKSANEKADDLLSDTLNVPMSEETYKQREELKAARDKQDNVKNTASYQFVAGLEENLPGYSAAQGFFGGLLPSTQGIEDKAAAQVASSADKYNNALNEDPAYKKYVTAQEEQAKKDKAAALSANLKKFGVPIVIGVVLLIILILVLKKKPQDTPKDEPTKPTKEVSNVDRTGELKVNYPRLLKANCEQLGLDYDKTLNQYNGDVRKAAESTQLMLR